VLLVARATPWVVLDGVLLAIASAQTVLLAHDAAHGAAFAHAGRVGRLMPHVLIGLFAGGSASWWRQSHNTHHALSNDRARDPDIAYPVVAFDLEQARQKRPWARTLMRHQHWLVWLFTPVVALNLRVYSALWLVRRMARRDRTARRALELSAMLLHWALYLALLASTLPPATALALAALHQGLFGTYLAIITSSNHWGMPMPDAETLTFLEHQVVTSRNIRGGAIVRFLYGGLDAQIEHHLFVALARPRLFEARSIVRAFCEERSIAYVERTPFEAMKDVYASLRAVARELSAHDARPPQDR
jgi:fatty acid desaturase